MRGLCVVVLWLLTSCASTSQGENPASLLASVNILDGVSREEADKIARAYFLAHVGCGVYSGISESPDAWVVEGKFGYSGDPIQGFLIDKHTGAIQSPVGPHYVHPKDML
jgi:hypothetical protein